MAGYIGSVPVPQATETRDVYTATSNQTTFTTGGYTPNFVSVYLNGVHLARADYTATNGSDVVLAAGAAADDTVEIVSFNTFELSAQTFTGDVTASGGTFLPTGDTAAGDDAAVGYAAADGLVLTGQGSTSDVTIKNDADATVMSIATGTTGATFAGDVIVPDGDFILGSTAVTSTAAELNILDGVTSTAAELNILDGVTSTAAELNKLDGVGTLKQAGKETIWVPASAMQPTTSNGCAALATVETTSGRPDMVVLDFDDGSDEHAQFSVAFPKSYNLGTVTFRAYWTTTATDTDGCTWGLQGVAMNDNETIDIAYGTAVVVDDAAQGAAEELYITAESGAITIAGTMADEDLCFFRVFRDVSDSNDDMAEDARLIGIKLFFTTDAANDA